MIELPTAVRDEIEAAARAGAPAEICGVLGGSFGVDHSRVRSYYPAENVAERPRTRYRIDPEAQLEVFDRLDERGDDIVGFVHSHPRGPSEPSDTDAALATWPDRSYVIVSLEDVSGAIGGRSSDGDGSGSSSTDGASAGSERTAQTGSWRWRDGVGVERAAPETDRQRGDGDGYFEPERVRLE
ncbi:Mov34/MPN/PAD-1 family protein [Halostagnicola larsenii XH-48]|uniref:Mov34/MPN/PAD-1 family protein n=1 Tax=Halostagnicola larsenii XH-48 TaxID=797299 RepID=W0JT08_9EURY|nr:Mov34/MPN/PAD-1 family protein [Halostagnicola larsenii XH-48]